MTAPVAVLKFGSSVLPDEGAFPRVVAEIQAWVAAGYRVLAVVSALGDTTDRLEAECHATAADPDPKSRAFLVSLGELRTVALLSLALGEAGTPATPLRPTQIELTTEGSFVDARPVGVNTDKVEQGWQSTPVQVLPGFLGCDSEGSTTLLGRGGSDLSAVFLAQCLQAQVCRLFKDTEGVFEWDPAQPGPRPRRYERIAWAEALALPGEVLQHKAVAFALEHEHCFDVGALESARFTEVGPATDWEEVASRAVSSPELATSRVGDPEGE